MTDERGLKLERINDLLAERALLGLSAEDEQELAHLLEDSSGDHDSFETTAARITLAFHPSPLEPLPLELRARIEKAASSHIGAATVEPTPKIEVERPLDSSRQSRFREMAAWLVAAACLLIVAAVLWHDRSSTPMPASVERAKLLAKAPDLVETPWTATGDPAARKATGDVVWSTSEQAGYMRFKGLAVNDPSKNEYQLWIFDSKQDPRYPIDGGVFDVGPATIDQATGDAIVPIHATLRVVSPKMFAVTVEKPGGVVVSSRDRIAVVAKVAAAGDQ